MNLCFVHKTSDVVRSVQNRRNVIMRYASSVDDYRILFPGLFHSCTGRNVQQGTTSGTTFSKIICSFADRTHNKISL